MSSILPDLSSSPTGGAGRAGPATTPTHMSREGMTVPVDKMHFQYNHPTDRLGGITVADKSFKEFLS